MKGEKTLKYLWLYIVLLNKIVSCERKEKIKWIFKMRCNFNYSWGRSQEKGQNSLCATWKGVFSRLLRESEPSPCCFVVKLIVFSLDQKKHIIFHLDQKKHCIPSGKPPPWIDSYSCQRKTEVCPHALVFPMGSYFIAGGSLNTRKASLELWES